MVGQFFKFVSVHVFLKTGKPGKAFTFFKSINLNAESFWYVSSPY